MNILRRKLKVNNYRYFCEQIKKTSNSVTISNIQNNNENENENNNKEIIEIHKELSSLNRHKGLTPQEKEKIASIALVTPEETKKIQKTILANQVYGFAGLFVSLLCLSTGVVMFLS